MDEALAHLGVAVDEGMVLESLLLDVACLDDALADGFALLALTLHGDFLEGDGAYLALYVYTVHQRTGNLGHVAAALAGGADAVVGGVAVVAAWAGVGTCHKHERAGVFRGVFCTRDGYLAVLQRLAEHLQG